MGKNLFNSIKLVKPRLNSFDLSHDVKLSMNMGELIPVLATECVPGDQFKIGAEALVRFAPMVAPVMHRIDVSVHYFFVPNRLLWDNWEDFITGNATPAFPYIQFGESSNYSRLADYMGVPRPISGVDEQVSAMPFSAYALIYNEYYRDQNLRPALEYKLINGDNGANTDLWDAVQRRAWEHDYFTSALPFAQKGASVDIPLGDVGLKSNWGTVGDPKFVNTGGAVPAGNNNVISRGPGTNDIIAGTDVVAYDPDGSLEVQATTINDLRRAFKLQEWLEKNARAGTRYIESILAHFGVKSSDARLQRPEYITGVKSPVTISEVLNTTGTTDAPQGNMAGHGIAVVNGQKGYYRCEEHGYIMGIMSVMPKTAYSQMMPKHLLKFDKFDYYWPEFAHIGEQAIQKREIYPYTVNGDDTFGYIPRYAEYRFENNRVAGDFRTTLNFWHMSRDFTAEPSLNDTFIECNPTHRIFAVTDPDEQKLYCQVYHHLKALRPMPKYGTPTF